MYIRNNLLTFIFLSECETCFRFFCASNNSAAIFSLVRMTMWTNIRGGGGIAYCPALVIQPNKQSNSFTAGCGLHILYSRMRKTHNGVTFPDGLALRQVECTNGICCSNFTKYLHGVIKKNPG
jgi:hypothetical protein